jgi:outer membrane receptor protein involved in Fe transport
VPHTPIKTDSSPRDNSDYTRNSLTLTGSWDMTPDNTLGLSLAYHDNEYGITPTAIYRETRRSGGTAHWYPRYWQFEEWKRTTVSLTQESRVTDSVRLRGRVFYDGYKSELNAYDDDTYSTQVRTAGAPSFDSEYDDYNTGVSLYGFYTGIENNEIRLGYSLKRDVHESTYAFSDGLPEYEKLVASTHCAAVEDAIHLTDNLRLTIGTSYDIYQQDQRDQASGSETGGSIRTFNPQAGLSYFPSSQVEIYTSAGKKTRFPTMRNLYADGVIGPQGNPDLDEERTYAYELGGKWQANTVATLEGALFYNDVRDLILFDNQIGRFEQYEKARMYGAEINLTAELSPGLSGKLGYTYLVAENDGSVVTVETEHLSSDLVYTPDEVPYRPKHKIDIDLTRSFDAGLNLHLNGSYVAGRIFYNHADPADNTVFIASREKLDDYFLLNAKMTYDFNSHHQVMVAVDNLLNENYQELYLSPAPGITGWVGYKFSL